MNTKRQVKGTIVLEKPNLRFFAAHFVAKLGKDGVVQRETLHGHNYRVFVKVVGTKDPDSPYIISKDDIQEATLKICQSLHNKMLVPMLSPALIVSRSEGHIEFTVKGTTEHFKIPLRDSMLLDLEHSSIEELCRYVTDRLHSELRAKNLTGNLEEIKVTVREYPGLECEICEPANAKM